MENGCSGSSAPSSLTTPGKGIEPAAGLVGCAAAEMGVTLARALATRASKRTTARDPKVLWGRRLWRGGEMCFAYEAAWLRARFCS